MLTYRNANRALVEDGVAWLKDMAKRYGWMIGEKDDSGHCVDTDLWQARFYC